MLSTVGVGFTISWKLESGPVHPLALGLMVMVAVSTMFVVFDAVNEAIFPVPLAAKPIPVFVFVQSNAVPDTEPVKVMAAVLAPLHRV